jgi:hypothetical protein
LPDAIFSLDRPAGSCYNGPAGAETGEAPILAGFAASVKRKNFSGAIFLGAINNIMLNEKTQWNQSLRAARLDITHYVKWAGYVISYRDVTLYHHP